MKSPIIFRAEFRQPKGKLNPMGLKMAGPIGVEIFHARSTPPQQWRARRPNTTTLFAIAVQNSPFILREQIETLYFEERLTGWQAFDSRMTPPRLLQASEWRAAKDGTVSFTERYEERLKAEQAKPSSTPQEKPPGPQLVK